MVMVLALGSGLVGAEVGLGFCVWGFGMLRVYGVEMGRRASGRGG